MTSLALLMIVALLGGLALNAASHLHTGGPAARAVFGCYLGLTMAHFVIDAGLWRLREEFPRSLLAAMTRRPDQVALPSAAMRKLGRMNALSTPTPAR